MPYPNSNVLNIVIPQTSASVDPSNSQAPFVERIISGSRLILQTTIDGTLTGSSDLNVNSITASNISASGYISASNLYVRTNITDAGSLIVAGTSTFNGLVSASANITSSNEYIAGTLVVIGNSTLSTVTASNISASGFVSASNEYISNTLTVVGNSTLSNVFATNITASNLSASGNVSSSTLRVETSIVDNGTLTVVGNSTLSNVFATNITASNISASGNISASTIRVETSIVDGGTLTVLGNTTLGDTTTDIIRITGSTSISGSLTVVGNTTLQNTFVANLTASNISASGFISGSDGIFAGDVAVNGGDITTTATTATLFNTNATSVNIGGAATTQVLLGNGVGTVKTAGDLVLGINNAIKDTSGLLGLTVSSSLTTVAGDLRVGGNDIQDSTGVNNLLLSSTRVNVPLTTQATDWTTGALAVAGGVGIGKNLHVSGSTFLYGDLTIYGSSSVVNISSSTVIIGDNRVVLNALVPFQRYSGIDVYDSGSANATSSFLWDGQTDNWTTVDQNNSASNIIIGPTSSFGVTPPNLTVNRLPKAYEGNAITDSALSDNGTTLSYTGTTISSSIITATTGSITYITGALVTYVTGSFNVLQVSTGSSPGTGQVPGTPTANGFVGQITVDNNFIYVYTGNIWKRVPISNWAP